MKIDLGFSVTGGQLQAISLEPGASLFVLGANGSGKSSLMQSFYQQAKHLGARRISAHRQTWFASNTLDMTPTAKKNIEQNINNTDVAWEARYKDTFAPQRAGMTLFELIDTQNTRARSIAKAVEVNDIEAALKLSLAKAPLAIINELLAQVNIPIEIDIIEGEQVVARKNGGSYYSVAELSDGERNSLLIAGDVLTARPEGILIIDEPERHLHRSIISPLLSQLFIRRSDCVFVIATHDVDLTLDNAASQVLIVRSANYQASAAQSWDADLIQPGHEIPESIKRDLLGSRRRIIYIEGSYSSLDISLYSIIFPDISVIPKSSCKEVENVVSGLQSTSSISWVKTWGIVDGDGQTETRIKQLKQKSIYAIPCYSVESIYYSAYVIGKVGERSAQLLFGNPETMISSAINSAIRCVQMRRSHMIKKSILRAARELIFSNLPTTTSIDNKEPIELRINVDDLTARKEAELDNLIQNGDWMSIANRYPIRESGALDIIAKELNFRGSKDYEAAVRSMLISDVEALNCVRSMFGDLYEEVMNA